MCDFTRIRKVCFMRYSLSSLFEIGKFGEICVINIITKAQGRVECNQGWSETCGHSKQVKNLVLLKPIFFKLLPCWTGLAKLFQGTSKTAV